MDDIKVFISFSGDRSKIIAEALNEWLPRCIQSVIPFLSADSVDKGTRWLPEIVKELQESNFGIICITRENVKEPWINFESGALSAAMKDKAFVAPYLFGVPSSEFSYPLSQFQATKADSKPDTLRLLKSINICLGQAILSDQRLEIAFQEHWPKLEQKLKEVPPENVVPPERSQKEMIEELLEISKGIARNVTAQSSINVMATGTVSNPNITTLRNMLAHSNVQSEYDLLKKILLLEERERAEGKEGIAGPRAPQSQKKQKKKTE